MTPALEGTKKPEEKTTVTMPAVPEWAIDLKRSFDGQKSSTDSVACEMRERLGRIENNQVEDRARLERVEKHQVDQDARADTSSIRAESESSNDLHRDAVTAALKTDVSTLKKDVASLKTSQAAQTEMLLNIGSAVKKIQDAVVGVITNSKVRTVGRVLFIIAATYAAGKGIKVLP